MRIARLLWPLFAALASSPMLQRAAGAAPPEAERPALQRIRQIGAPRDAAPLRRGDSEQARTHQPADPARAGLAYKRGLYRQAAPALVQALAEAPNDPDLNLYLGVTRIRLGQPADALPHLRDAARGAAAYESDGIGAHAEALRSMGVGAEAAALRLQRRVIAPEEDEMMILLNAVEDHLSGGDLAAAEALAWEAMSLYPNAPVAHAWAAEVAMSAGDLEAAGFHLWMASSAPSLRLKLASARLALLEGAPWRAERILRETERGQFKSWRAAVLLTDALIAQGLPEEALYWVRLPTFRSLDLPEILGAEIRALQAAGRDDEAAPLLRRAAALYPEHPAILALR